jgi:hypothetical protein
VMDRHATADPGGRLRPDSSVENVVDSLSSQDPTHIGSTSDSTQVVVPPVQAFVPSLVGVSESSMLVNKSCPMPASIGNGAGVLDLEPALVSDPAGFGSSVNPMAIESATQRLVTRLQNTIKRPKVYTDGTIHYGCLIMFEEPDNIEEAMSHER